MNRNVWLLFCCQALMNAVMSGQTVMSALIGHALAVDKSLNTLPMAIQMTATMTASIPAGIVFARLGRKPGFWLGCVGSLLGSLTFALGVWTQNFQVLLHRRRLRRPGLRHRPAPALRRGRGVTVQSGIDSNMNGDSAGDRSVINPNGIANVGSGTTALTNTAGQTVAYLVNNPNARYIDTPKGVLPNSARNTMRVNPIDDIDMTIAKYIGVGKEDRYKLRFEGRFFNIFNHPQYVAGNISDVASVGFTGTAVHNSLLANNGLFGQWSQVFSNNPRTIQVSVKLEF